MRKQNIELEHIESIELEHIDNSDYHGILDKLSNYTAYLTENTVDITSLKKQLISQIEYLKNKNKKIEEPCLVSALNNTCFFLSKQMRYEDYKRIATTMPGSASPRLKKFGIALTSLGFLALVVGMALIIAIAASGVGLGLLGWLGFGGVLGGMCIFPLGMQIVFNSQASGVSATMEQIADTAVKTGLISPDATSTF